jgi:hypothetical protein
MECPLWAKSGLMQCNKKKDRLAAVLSISDLHSRRRLPLATYFAAKQ